MSEIVPVSNSQCAYKGSLEVVGNDHFRGARNIAVDIEDMEELHDAISAKFKIKDEFVLTAFDLDHQKDVWLTEENLLKMIHACAKKIQVRHPDHMESAMNEEAEMEAHRTRSMAIARNRYKECTVTVANGFCSNDYLVDQKAVAKRQRHVDEAIQEFRQIDDSKPVPPGRALWRLNPHYKYCSFWYICVVLLRGLFPCCCRGDVKSIASVNYIHRGQFEDMRRCIGQGQDPNEKDMKGRTMLSIAVMQETSDVFQLLLGAGANPNIPDENTGLTPMHHAATQADRRMMERLIVAGGDINTPDPKGTTPMMLACQSGSIEVVQTIVAAAMFPEDGFREAVDVVDVRDNQGWTPLHYAASGGQVEAAMFLVEDSHINTHTKDRNGHTAAVVGERTDPKGAPGEVAAYLNSQNEHLHDR